MNPVVDVYISDEAVAHLIRLPWDALEAIADMLGKPTEGHIPWALWRKSNTAPIPEAIWWMEKMGFKPFVGYPLQLLRPREPWAEAIHQALESAYDEIRRGLNEDTGPNPILTVNSQITETEVVNETNS